MFNRILYCKDCEKYSGEGGWLVHYHNCPANNMVVVNQNVR